MSEFIQRQPKKGPKKKPRVKYSSYNTDLLFQAPASSAKLISASLPARSNPRRATRGIGKSLDDGEIGELIQAQPKKGPRKRPNAIYSSDHTDLLSKYFPPPAQKKMFTTQDVQGILNKRRQLDCIKSQFSTEQITSKVNRMNAGSITGKKPH